MTPTTYQTPEIRDSNDNIIKQGSFGKNTALANSTNDGWIDYVANDLEFLYSLAKDEVVPVPSLPASGQMNKTYLLTTTGVSYRWSGTQWVAVSSSEAVGRAETAATNAQNYANAAQQSADDAQDTADDMADHLVQIDKNTGGVAKNSKRISNIEKLLQGNLYDYDTDDDAAYTKTVPSGALPYAGIEQIGGKTVVWNQLVNSGTTTVATISGHKYYTLIDGTASIVTSSGSAITIVDDSADMVCDLTLMFGAGNEPSTVAEFKAMFPADYYEYNSGELLSAGVTEVVSKKADTTTIATYSIPAEIRSLEGYGWSAGSVYNYIDYERKVFVQRVGRVVLDGTQTIVTKNWRPSKNGVGWIYPYYVARCNVVGNSVVPNLVCDKFVTTDYDHLYDYVVGTSTYFNNDRSICIWQSNTSLTNVTAINAYLSANPITVYYELATPVETDISAYITDDNLIEVESGGTLTFPNSNGDDYHIPVPSDVTYMIDLQEAVSNG